MSCVHVSTICGSGWVWLTHPLPRMVLTTARVQTSPANLCVFAPCGIYSAQMTTQLQEAQRHVVRDRTLLGHPIGLGPLFFTELWERFSYYGMRAILILYMVAPPAQGGLGFDTKHAASIYGTYTMSVYLTALPGGLAADYLLGARLAVLLGGIVIACGHFSMVFHSMTSFYLGMVLIAVGTGLLKPNISAMIGGLYRENDARRDSGFSIFYMGINVGAVLAPLVCGYLAQSGSFKQFLVNRGDRKSTR